MSREASDDDSSLSVNSTVPSEQREEYPLEGILAERVSNGVKEFLVKWQGYPEERSTWETESNFRNDTTIPEWEHKKLRIRRKLDEPFDVSALETKVERWVAETKQRKARRRAKRIRMGLPVAPEETGEEEPADAESTGDTSSSEAIEGDLEPLDVPKLRTGARRRKNSSSSITIQSEHEEVRIPLRQQKIEKKPPNVQRRRMRKKPTTLDEDSETAEEFTRRRSAAEEPSVQARQIGNIEVAHERKQRHSNKSRHASRDTKQAQDNGTLNQRPQRKESQPQAKPFPQHETSIPKPISSLPKFTTFASSNFGQAGRGPARLGQARKSPLSGAKPRVTGAAILSNWAAKIRTRKPLAFRQTDIREDGERTRTFGKLSVKRRYQKAGRYEPAPNPDDLTFVNLKDGKPIKKPSAILSPMPYKTPFQMIQDGLTEANKPVGTSSRDVDMVDLPNGDDDRNIILDARTDSPQDIGISGELMQSGDSHCNQESLSLVGNALQASSRELAPSAVRIQPVVSPTDQAPFSPFEAHGSLSRRQTEPSPMLAHNSFPVETSAQAVLAPMHEKGLQPSGSGVSIWSERREPSRDYPAGELHVRPSEKADIHSETPDTSQRFPLAILRGDAGYHQGLHHNNYKPYQHEHNSLENLSDVLGTILIGLEHKEIADVRFRGLNRACKQHFMRIKMPPRQMHEKYMYYGAGHIVPWPSNQSIVNIMTDTLISHDAGGLFFSPSYSLVVYPSGLNSWKFFDDRFVDSPQAGLRFSMFTPVPELLNHTTQQMAQVMGSSALELESEANVLFQQFFGVKYTNILWQGNTNRIQKDNFYLMYPAELEEEKNVISLWLEANTAKIYSSFEVGGWDKFTSSVEAGVVLIHESVTRLHVIPGLARLLRRPFNIFFINLRPDRSKFEDGSSKCRLTRLFPHGGGILLTDSLFLNCPEAAVRILTWFRIYILHSKPDGTWKLVTRPRIRDWILSIVEERTKEEGHIFMQIYEQIYYILPHELMDETDDYETPKEEAPFVSAREIAAHDPFVGRGDRRNDVEGIARNDEVLADWFAGWTRTRVEYLRKFHIVHEVKEGGEAVRKGWMKKWSHIAALTPDEFYKMHGVVAWEVKDKEKAEQRHREREKRKASAAGLEHMVTDQGKRSGSRKSSLVQ
ncbi:hypothetical protein MMC26_003611 [Xylographa opegraphella]|nr:hypothetical protein [Xylographa opegraphella]